MTYNVRSRDVSNEGLNYLIFANRMPTSCFPSNNETKYNNNNGLSLHMKNEILLLSTWIMR